MPSCDGRRSIWTRLGVGPPRIRSTSSGSPKPDELRGGYPPQRSRPQRRSAPPAPRQPTARPPRAAPAPPPAPAPGSLPLAPPTPVVIDGVDHIEGKDLTLLYEGKKCIPARFCVTWGPKVFL